MGAASFSSDSETSYAPSARHGAGGPTAPLTRPPPPEAFSIPRRAPPTMTTIPKKCAA